MINNEWIMTGWLMTSGWNDEWIMNGWLMISGWLMMSGLWMDDQWLVND